MVLRGSGHTPETKASDTADAGLRSRHYPPRCGLGRISCRARRYPRRNSLWRWHRQRDVEASKGPLRDWRQAGTTPSMLTSPAEALLCRALPWLRRHLLGIGTPGGNREAHGRSNVAYAEAALVCHVCLDCLTIDCVSMTAWRADLTERCRTFLSAGLRAEPDRQFRPALVAIAALPLPSLLPGIDRVLQEGGIDLTALRPDQLLETHYWLGEAGLLPNHAAPIEPMFVAGASAARGPGALRERGYPLTHMAFYSTRFGKAPERGKVLLPALLLLCQDADAEGDLDVFAEAAFAAWCCGNPAWVEPAVRAALALQSIEGWVPPFRRQRSMTLDPDALTLHATMVSLLPAAAMLTFK